MNEDYSFLINSCDAYSDSWNILFRTFEKHWKNLDAAIFLNTESLHYQDDKYKVHMVLSPERGGGLWGYRLKKAAKTIQTPYIITFMDDFFLYDDVEEQMIIRALAFLKTNPNAAVVHLDEKNGSGKKPIEELDIELMSKDTYSVVNCGPSIWRRDALIECSRDFINAWQFESLGTWLAKKTNYDFYRVKGCGDAFHYYRKYGGGIHKGKWVGKVVRPILEEYNIDLDLSRRGVIEDWTVEGQAINRTLYDKIHDRLVKLRVILC